MKAVILAGGRGSRLSEETGVRPKPLVEIGGRPIIWHIMSIYAAHGITDFVVCAGYKGYLLKEYFANLGLHDSDVTFDLGSGEVTYHQPAQLPWRVTVADTGLATMTGGRVRRVREYLEPTSRSASPTATGSATSTSRRRRAAPARWRARDDDRRAAVGAVRHRRGRGRAGSREMLEKHPSGATQVNGGFFVVEPGGARPHRGRPTCGRATSCRRLAADGRLAAYQHDGLLAADGHGLGARAPRRACGRAARRPGRSGERQRPGAVAACSSRGTPASRARG